MQRLVKILFLLVLAIGSSCTRPALLTPSNNNLQNESVKNQLIPNFSVESNPNLTDLDVILANGALSNVLNNSGQQLIENWRNPLTGHFGEITPSTHFWVNQTFCLNYIHSYQLDEIAETQQGVACQKDNGRWLDYS